MTTEANPGSAPATRADFPVLRPITTRWADNDVYGHVNNVVYYAFFDTAVNGWLSFPEPVEAGLRLEKLGRFVHVYVDTATRKPTPVPALIRTALAQLT